MTTNMMWIPAMLLAAGAAASAGTSVQRDIPLKTDLANVVPADLHGLRGTDQVVSDEEQRVAGMDDYLLRSYATAATAATAFSIYVGYYEKQSRGHTIHSPKNCLPGAGWEALTSTTTMIQTPDGRKPVTKYLLKRENERAVVLYWYQGRGRVEANEYKVKLNLLRDAAFRRRSDEALVRIVVPVTTDEAGAEKTAVRVAADLVPALWRALPE